MGEGLLALRGSCLSHSATPVQLESAIPLWRERTH